VAFANGAIPGPLPGLVGAVAVRAAAMLYDPGPGLGAAAAGAERGAGQGRGPIVGRGEQERTAAIARPAPSIDSGSRLSPSATRTFLSEGFPNFMVLICRG
jgi:hypothetical protein